MRRMFYTYQNETGIPLTGCFADTNNHILTISDLSKKHKNVRKNACSSNSLKTKQNKILAQDKKITAKQYTKGQGSFTS